MTHGTSAQSLPSVAGIRPAEPPAPAPCRIEISWKGEPWSLAGLALLNVLLTVVTLGFYQFWARTEVRRRIWSFVRIDGEPLAYTGTGGELCKGFLLVALVVLVPVFAISLLSLLAFGPHSSGYLAAQVATFLLFMFLGGVAVYRARRYRLSRTTWRGIRGSLTGSSWAYGWTSFWTLLLVPLALVAVVGASIVSTGGTGSWSAGLMRVLMSVAALPTWAIVSVYLGAILVFLALVPWRMTLLQRRIVGDMAFGSRSFTFEGRVGPLYVRFVARWIGVLVLAIAVPVAIISIAGTSLRAIQQATTTREPPPPMPTIEIVGMIAILLIAGLLYSLITAWYKAAEQRYFASVTRYESQPFRLAIKAPELICLTLTNWFITVLSLGILRPVASARTARFFVERLALDGPIDVAGIMQAERAGGRTGEGLAQAFDVDAF
jgi:uncharacterized membrane protein YjgN (DUF898 family)